MSEQQSVLSEYSSLESKIRETDPREYLGITSFQKHARQIDKDPSHPWEETSFGTIWTENSGSELMASSIIDPNTTNKNLLVLATNSEGKTISGYIKDLDESVRSFVEDKIRVVANRYPVEKRQEFIGKLLEISPQLQKLTRDEANFKVTLLAIDILPDLPSAKPLDYVINLPEANDGISKVASEWQKGAAQRVMEKVSRKIPQEVFEDNLKDFLKWIPYTDHIYGRNFDSIFRNAADWVVSNRPDTMINEADLRNPKTDKKAIFPVKQLIKRFINSTEDLKEILSKMPVKPVPYISYDHLGREAAEFVDLNKVVGGAGITDWSVVSNSAGRGIENIERIIRGFMNNTYEIERWNEPIKVVEIKGEYFVTGDGRHRIAALKALDVPFAPMIVARETY